MTKLSIRRLWTAYKRIGIAGGVYESDRDLAIAHSAFYAGARGVLKVLDHMLAQGHTVQAHQAIRRVGRENRAIQAGGRAARRRKSHRLRTRSHASANSSKVRADAA
jgi:hypothetical protein